MMPPLAVSQLTAAELSPPEMVRAAAAAGCQFTGIRMIPVLPGGFAYPLMDDPALLRATRDAVAETGVGISDLEIVMLRPETDVAGFEAFLNAGAAVGARHVLVAGYDPERGRLVERYAAFCDLAAAHGLTADIEFMPWSNIPDMASAIEVAAAAGRPNAGVLLDTMHFDRSGSRITDIGRADPAWLHYWQICDAPGPRPDTTEELLRQAREERLFPGEGGLDLASQWRALPAQIPVSIEVPKAALARTTNGAERIRLAAEATRAWFAAHARED